MTEDSLNKDLGANLPRRHKLAGDSASMDSDWQRRLLPFLIGTLIGVTILFSVAIAWQTRSIQNRMERALDVDLRPLANSEFRTNGPFLLEANLIERRYRAANAAALSRIYLVFLGFGTGMVMAMVGATFILGKFSEPQTSIDGGASSVKASLRSGSPGVILAFFGTALMLSTIFSKTEISVTDRAVYVGGGSEADTTPAPEASVKLPETDKTHSRSTPAVSRASHPGVPVAAVRHNNATTAGVQLSMASAPSLNGTYKLEAIIGGHGTLSIRGQDVQFTASDGKKVPVNSSIIGDSEITFSLTGPDGADEDFDGFLSEKGSIVGQTSYHGSWSSKVYGFEATRIGKK